MDSRASSVWVMASVVFSAAFSLGGFASTPILFQSPFGLVKFLGPLLPVLLRLLISCDEAFLTDDIKGLLDMNQELLWGSLRPDRVANSTLWGNVNFSVLALESTAS
jgi:hypothetical protein